MTQVPMCKICLEPIYNPICSSCLFKQAQKWIDREAKFLGGEVENIHRTVVDSFPNTKDNTEKCIKCKRTTADVFCPFCYIRELYFGLKKFDKDIANKLAYQFDFDFEDTGFDTESAEKAEPLFPVESIDDFGICESCEQISDLKRKENRFLCEVCIS